MYVSTQKCLHLYTCMYVCIYSHAVSLSSQFSVCHPTLDVEEVFQVYGIRYDSVEAVQHVCQFAFIGPAHRQSQGEWRLQRIEEHVGFTSASIDE